jgi:transcriptional regulator with XRE-family HTH domain
VYRYIPAQNRKKIRSCNRADNTLGAIILHKATPPIYNKKVDIQPDNTPGSRLKKTRLKKRITIKELAEMSGMSAEQLSNIECGKSGISISNLRRLAKILNVSVAYLGCFEDMPEDTPDQQLKKARYYHGLTIKETAEKIGVDYTTIRRWENDHSKPLEKYNELVEKFVAILRK